MWRLNRIYAENLLTFCKLEYTLSQGVTSLIFGNNQDNESQGSNGSGKSALIECIAIGLTGLPLRKAKNEEVINDKAEECTVHVELKNDVHGEVLIVTRRISRKSSSSVNCFTNRTGELIQTVLPSVEEYNRFILDKLGISREELYNNFILSKFKYQDFLSSSDRDKKEIINCFSNGILVDKAIEKLNTDKLPVTEEFRKAELEVAGIEGRIGMLAEQIEREENGRMERARTKNEKFKAMRQRIAEKRVTICQKNEEVNVLTNCLRDLDEVDRALQELENSDYPLGVYLSMLKKLLSPFPIELSDWEKIMNEKESELNALQMEDKELKGALDEANERVAGFIKRHECLSSEYTVFSKDHKKATGVYDVTIKAAEEEIVEVNRKYGCLREERRVLSKEIEELTNRLAGTISCPACGHEFLVSDKDFNVIEAIGELESKRKRIASVIMQMTEQEKLVREIERKKAEVLSSKRELSTRNNNWLDRLEESNRGIRSAERVLDEVNAKEKRVKGRIACVLTEIEGIRKKVFDEAFDRLDVVVHDKERTRKVLQEDIMAIKGSIGSLDEAIRELENIEGSDLIGSLKDSMKVYQKKLADATCGKLIIERDMRRLDEQEQYFVEFKTYLANTKIEALGTLTNEFLEGIGSDIRIRFSGYTVLKSKKVRDKISVSLVRDGVDMGSFGKFSAGEAARVNLATILAMQKLINNHCDTGKGLDLLVLDEILEAVDEDGLASVFMALNRMRVTALVVSHGNIAESYPHKLLVCKTNGESRIVL